MSKEKLDLVDSITSLEDLELYEEILELRVKAQSKLIIDNSSSLMKDSSGILFGGLGGWLVSQFFKGSNQKKNSKDDNHELNKSKESVLNQIDHYIGLFQKWSPVLRAVIAESEHNQHKRQEQEVNSY